MLDLQHGRHFIDAGLALGLGHLADFQGKPNVVGHAHGGVERVALKHHGDVALRRWRVHHIALTHQDAAFGGLLQASNDVEQSGFAATRRPDQDQELTVRDVNVDALEHLHLFVALPKSLAHATYRQ